MFTRSELELITLAMYHREDYLRKSLDEISNPAIYKQRARELREHMELDKKVWEAMRNA